MTAYAPSGLGIVAVVVALVAGTLAAGFAVMRMPSRPRARALAWTIVLAATIGVERLAAGEPPGFRMVAIIVVLFSAMKGVVAVDGLPDGATLTLHRWLAFATWPGMRPALFVAPSPAPLPGATALLALGATRFAMGATLCLAAHLVWIGTRSLPLATVLLLPGISFVLHFGLFNLAAGTWRLAGVEVEPLFRAPLRSTTLTEFWGRRWNLAFSEMTSIGVYRPISGVLGRRVGLLAAFVASGLLHEVAISVPVKAGFGLPLCYFAVHGVAVLVEKALERRGTRIDATPWVGRLWTITWLLVPLPILFHPPFLAGIVWPLLG